MVGEVGEVAGEVQTLRGARERRTCVDGEPWAAEALRAARERGAGVNRFSFEDHAGGTDRPIGVPGSGVFGEVRRDDPPPEGDPELPKLWARSNGAGTSTRRAATPGRRALTPALGTIVIFGGGLAAGAAGA